MTPFDKSQFIKQYKTWQIVTKDESKQGMNPQRGRQRTSLRERPPTQSATLRAGLQVQRDFRDARLGWPTVKALQAEPALVVTIKLDEPQRSLRR